MPTPPTVALSGTPPAGHPRPQAGHGTCPGSLGVAGPAHRSPLPGPGASDEVCSCPVRAADRVCGSHPCVSVSLPSGVCGGQCWSLDGRGEPPDPQFWGPSWLVCSPFRPAVGPPPHFHDVQVQTQSLSADKLLQVCSVIDFHTGFSPAQNSLLALLFLLPFLHGCLRGPVWGFSLQSHTVDVQMLPPAPKEHAERSLQDTPAPHPGPSRSRD